VRPSGRTPQESKTAIALFPFLEDNSVNFVPNLAPTGMLNGLPFWYGGLCFKCSGFGDIDTFNLWCRSLSLSWPGVTYLVLLSLGIAGRERGLISATLQLSSPGKPRTPRFTRTVFGSLKKEVCAMNHADIGKRSRRGPVPLPDAERRVHCVAARLTADELAQLDSARGRFQRGEWMRMAGIGRLPPTIPQANLQAWAALATAVSNLNQYQAAINQNIAQAIPADVLDALRDGVQSLRRDLIGANSEEDPDEGHE
jgi:hypothetical protein